MEKIFKDYSKMEGFTLDMADKLLNTVGLDIRKEKPKFSFWKVSRYAMATVKIHK